MLSISAVFFAVISLIAPHKFANHVLDAQCDKNMNILSNAKIVSKDSRYTNPEAELVNINFNTTNIMTGDHNFNYKFFNNSLYNYPRNNYGNCVYSAFALYLAYLDTYWNDIIVDEEDEYNVNISSASITGNYNSAGVLDTLADDPTLSAIEYNASQIYPDISSVGYKTLVEEGIMDAVYEEIDNESLIGGFFQSALDCGGIAPHFDRNGNVINSGYLDGLGLGYEEQCVVWLDYINSNQTLLDSIKPFSSRWIDGVNQTQEKNRIESEVINLLENDIPVILYVLGYSDTNNNGTWDTGEPEANHECIAYDYDDWSETIYANMGWQSSSNTHVDISSIFKRGIYAYMAFGFNSNLQQDYTDNYFVTDYYAHYSPNNNRIFNRLVSDDFYVNSLNTPTTCFIEDSDYENYFNALINSSIETTTDKIMMKGTLVGSNSPSTYIYTFNRYVNRIEGDFFFYSSSDFSPRCRSRSYQLKYTTGNNSYVLIDFINDYNLGYGASNSTHIGVNINYSNVTKISFQNYADRSSSTYKSRLCVTNLIICYYF